MRDMKQLPPEQRAVLSLVLTQGRSYGEVASMLGIAERSVRERAHAALDALADGGATPDALADGGALGARGGATMPDALADGGATPHALTGGGATPSAAGDGHEADGTDGRGAGSRRASRTAGALLLAAIVAAVALAAILLSSGGKGSGQPARHAASRSPATSTTAAAGRGGGEVRLDRRFSLTSTDPASRASGEGLVVSEGSRRAFYVTARGLPPSSGFFYAVWLYNSQSDSWPLGRAPAVGSSGRLEGGGPLTAPRLASFHRLVITRETSTHPGAPGQIVLSGPFGLR